MRLSKKFAAIAITAGVALTATAAFAYWTTTGAGDGSAAAASANGELVLHAIIDVGDATAIPPVPGHAPYPGGSNPVSFTADNAGDTNLWVETLTVDSIEVSNAVSPTNLGGCDAADFSVTDVTTTQQKLIPANTDGVALPTGTDLVFANSLLNQDGCKGEVITLNLSSN